MLRRKLRRVSIRGGEIKVLGLLSRATGWKKLLWLMKGVSCCGYIPDSMLEIPLLGDFIDGVLCRKAFKLSLRMFNIEGSLGTPLVN